MRRDPNSHKGDNGKVVVIGGSRTIHGAPILSALAAEAAGVDLVFLCVPCCHEDVAKHAALNVQVHPFFGDEFSEKDIEPILELLATMDSAVIGPGIARESSAVHALNALIESAPCPLVLDATALQKETLYLVRGKNAVLTPHLGELERMELGEGTIAQAAKQHQCTIVLKGPIDRIASSDGTTHEVRGGNAGLTVGGTGDTLAGLIAGLRALSLPAPQACITACTIVKRAGTLLFQEKGYAYRAQDVIHEIPHLLHTYEVSS